MFPIILDLVLVEEGEDINPQELKNLLDTWHDRMNDIIRLLEREESSDEDVLHMDAIVRIVVRTVEILNKVLRAADFSKEAQRDLMQVVSAGNRWSQRAKFREEPHIRNMIAAMKHIQDHVNDIRSAKDPAYFVKGVIEIINSIDRLATAATIPSTVTRSLSSTKRTLVDEAGNWIYGIGNRNKARIRMGRQLL